MFSISSQRMSPIGKRVDCKSLGLCLHRFESCSYHHLAPFLAGKGLFFAWMTKSATHTGRNDHEGEQRICRHEDRCDQGIHHTAYREPDSRISLTARVRTSMPRVPLRRSMASNSVSLSPPAPILSMRSWGRSEITVLLSLFSG